MTSVVNRCRILFALIIRDLLARFGRQHLGFIWTVIEPMLLTTGVMFVWSQLKEPIIHGVPVAAFALTGYMPLTLSRHFTGAMTGLMRHSSPLLYHAPISHIDIAVSRLILEFLSATLAFVVIYFIVVSTGITPPAANPSLALAGWLMSGWHFAAVGLLTGMLTEYWEPLEKFVQPWQYLQLPISGCFIMAEWMPSSAQKLLLLNPSVHCYEMLRAGFFGDEIVTHYDVGYLALTTAAITLVGAYALAGVRKHIEVH